MFDSSVERGEPYAGNHAGGFIQGFTEGLLMMSVGSKYKLWIPVELGYFNVPGHPLNNTPLVFEVELLEIVNN
jgi:FKBP-type peptidyl-prolyl cis-trans isomerase